MRQGLPAGMCAIAAALGCAGPTLAAEGSALPERGKSPAASVSLDDGRLRVAMAPGFAGNPDIAVDYEGVGDDWSVVSDEPLQAGPGCELTLSGVLCPENGEDVIVEFGDEDGEVTLAPADDDLHFDSRVTLGAGLQSIETASGDDVVTTEDERSPMKLAHQIETLGGNDEIEGSLGPDTIQGGAGDDTIVAGPGDDILEGGSDAIAGPDGADSFTGGGGKDTLSYARREDDVTATIGGVGGAPGEGDVIGGNVESLIGGLGDDVLVGDDDSNSLRGGNDGDDTLFGGSGTGPDGADEFRAGSGVSTNIDTVSYANRKDAITASLTGTSSDGDDISSDVDILIGGTGGDTLTGDSDPNTLVGGRGQDSMFALDGPDTIDARDDGPDTSDCGSGTDTALTDSTATETVTGCETIDPAPDTLLTEQPERRTTKRRALFSFESATAGVSDFECSLDGNEFAPCSSPFRVSGLSLGRHVFLVRAIDADGDRDISPAKATFRVVSG